MKVIHFFKYIYARPTVHRKQAGNHDNLCATLIKLLGVTKYLCIQNSKYILLHYTIRVINILSYLSNFIFIKNMFGSIFKNLMSHTCNTPIRRLEFPQHFHKKQPM